MFMSDPGRGIIGGVLIAEAGYCRSAAGMLLGYVSSVPSKLPASLERCTQTFAETPISLVPVCLGPAKLSLKSGLAEVNIVHLHSGHVGPWRPQR
jgi:hypothetical protein